MQRGSKKNRLIDTWVGIPLLNVIASLRIRRKYPDKIERIGVICSLALGDTLLFSAALRSVRSHFSNQHLTFFCGPQNIAAAELIPGVDELVTISLLKPLETVRRIRDQHLDLLLDFTSWQRLTAFYTLMSGACFTVGFRTAGQYRDRGYDRAVSHTRNNHEIDNFRALLRSIGVMESCAPFIVPRQTPKPQLIAHRKRVIVFHPWPSGVHSYTREWPEKRWLALAKALVADSDEDTLFVVTGSAADQVRSEPFAHALRAAGLEAEAFIGRDRFDSLCQILLHATLVVSVNTGVMHLSAILGAPTISLNGPNTNRRWGPVGSRAIGLESPGEGCGYLHLGFESAKGVPNCMERITVEMVLAAADQLTKSAQNSPASNPPQLDGVLTS